MAFTHMGLFEGIGGFSLAARWMGYLADASRIKTSITDAMLSPRFSDKIFKSLNASSESVKDVLSFFDIRYKCGIFTYISTTNIPYKMAMTIEGVIKMYFEENLSQKEIGERFGVSQKAVFAFFKRNGIVSRNASKRNQIGENNAFWKGGKTKEFLKERAIRVNLEKAKDPKVGDRFTRLLVVELMPTPPYTRRRVLCKCNCGKTLSVLMSSLKRNPPQVSCGCLTKETLSALRLKHGMIGTPKYDLLAGAKRRATQKGLDFNIEPTDIKIPSTCPLLGIPLKKGIGKLCRNSPSLDRINPTKGYVKGNVWVISYRANSIKSDSTIEELELLLNNLKNETRKFI